MIYSYMPAHGTKIHVFELTSGETNTRLLIFIPESVSSLQRSELPADDAGVERTYHGSR